MFPFCLRLVSTTGVEAERRQSEGKAKGCCVHGVCQTGRLLIPLREKNKVAYDDNNNNKGMICIIPLGKRKGILIWQGGGIMLLLLSLQHMELFDGSDVADLQTAQKEHIPSRDSGRDSAMALSLINYCIELHLFVNFFTTNRHYSRKNTYICNQI